MAPTPAEKAVMSEVEADRSSHKRVILLVVVPLIVAVASVVFYLLGGRYVETDNAYVKADKVSVSSDVSGMVQIVMVRENQVVNVGEPLLQLDPATFELAVKKAEARLAQVKTDLLALKASYREKLAEVDLAKTRFDFAKKEQKRQEDLIAKHYVSASQLENAQQTSQLALQQLNASKQDLGRIIESLGGDLDAPVESHPSYLVALSELDQARLNLEKSVVRAPIGGRVSKIPQPGQYVSAGSSIMALVASAEPWIEANFIETDLTHVRPGQTVAVRVDTYPDRSWEGIVESLSPATGAEFSVLPAQNATGNWVKVAQRVPVRIKLIDDGAMAQLLAGLSAVVEIDTGYRRQLLGVSL
ncbi:hemolysin D [Hahella sp. CCB-MM4]|nr:hemolysin D [Hahella sp. CCB-MM4]